MSLFIIIIIIHQVLSVTSAACLCNTSWAAFWLRYSSSHYDGDYTYTIIHTYIYQHYYTYICSTFLSPPEDFKKAAIHRRNTFYGRFIGGALTFLLGTGTYSRFSLSKSLHWTLTMISQSSEFEPIALPQVGLVAGSLGLTLGYGMGWSISLTSLIVQWTMDMGMPMQYGRLKFFKICHFCAIGQEWAQSAMQCLGSFLVQRTR